MWIRGLHEQSTFELIVSCEPDLHFEWTLVILNYNIMQTGVRCLYEQLTFDRYASREVEFSVCINIQCHCFLLTGVFTVCMNNQLLTLLLHASRSSLFAWTINFQLCCFMPAGVRCLHEQSTFTFIASCQPEFAVCMNNQLSTLLLHASRSSLFAWTINFQLYCLHASRSSLFAWTINFQLYCFVPAGVRCLHEQSAFNFIASCQPEFVVCMNNQLSSLLLHASRSSLFAWAINFQQHRFTLSGVHCLHQQLTVNAIASCQHHCFI